MKIVQNKNGFTIVELLIGITMAAMFAGTFSVLLANASKTAQRGRDLAVANSFAENKIEELRSAGYLAVNIGTFDITSELPSELQESREALLTISTVPAAIKKVELNITYNDQGRQVTYSYITYIGEIGVGQS